MGLAVRKPNVFFSYFADFSTVALWKFDEVEDNSYFYDWSENEYHLVNNGFQEKHPCALFGFGTRPYGGDFAYRSLSSSSNLKITENLTIDLILRFEVDYGIGVKTCLNVGHDVYNNRYGFFIWIESNTLYWKICTNSGIFSCSTSVTVGEMCQFRFIYDFSNQEISIWKRFLISGGCNTESYPHHLKGEFENLKKVSSANADGKIVYDTFNYDWISLAKSWNTNISEWDYVLSSIVYDCLVISNSVRVSDLIFDNNIVPREDGIVNLGSRLRRFDSVHAVHLFGNLGSKNVKDYSVDWGSDPFQVNATSVPIDSNGDYSGTALNVQDALEELWSHCKVANICYVSHSFTTDEGILRFHTVKEALDWVRDNGNSSENNPWLVYIYPGVYSEPRGTWVENYTEASLIIPDFCFLCGADRESVILKPDSVVAGEPMNFLSAIWEKDKSPTASSHIGVSNVTIKDCVYGNAIQLDSFIKKPDYPEFRLYVDNVKIVNCDTGIKAEERNSWAYVNTIYLENCNIGLHVDDAKMFADNVVIRQKGATGTRLSKGIYAEDKKGKIQVFNLEIGVDKFGLDEAYQYGIQVEDKAEIHCYSARIDNAREALHVSKHGEFKGWNVKFHDSALYDINVADTEDNSVEVFAGELDSPVIVNGGDFKLRNCDLNTDDKNNHSIQWASSGKFELMGCKVKSAGKVSGVNYYCVNFIEMPSSFKAAVSSFRYESSNDRPDYLIYSANKDISSTIIGCGLEVGVNRHIIIESTTKNVGGALDFYETIGDALGAAQSGDLVLVNPGTYNEQISMKGGVTVKGTNKDSCILQYSDQPITPWSAGGGSASVSNMTLKTTTPNNIIVELRNGYYDLFTDCDFLNGKIVLNGPNLSGFPQFEFQSCTFRSDGHFVLEASGSTSMNVKIVLKDCKILEESKGILWSIVKTGGWLNRIYLKNTDVLWGKIETSGTVELIVEGGTHYNEGGVEPNIASGSTGRLAISKASYENDGNRIVTFSVAPSEFVFSNNVVKGSTNYDLYSTVVINNANVIGNVMKNGMNGNIRVAATTKHVQGGIDFYKTIQDAISASGQGNLVDIAPGTYTEQITAKNKVILKGTDKDTTIIQNTDNVLLWASDFHDGRFENLTFKVTTGGNCITDVKCNYPTFDTCIFKSGKITANSQTLHFNACFKSCLFNWYEHNIIDVNDTNSSYNCIFTFNDCNFSGDINFLTVRGQLRIKNCNLEWCKVLYRATGSAATIFKLSDSYLTREGSDLVTLEVGGSGVIASAEIINNNIFEETGHNAIVLKTNPNFLTISKNKLSAVTGFDVYVFSGVVVGGVLFNGNAMVSGVGGEGTFRHENPVKYVGGSLDFYKTIHDALKGISADGQKIVLNEDQSIFSAFNVPSYKTEINGLNGYTLSRGAGNAITVLTSESSIIFKDIVLVGSLDVSGDNIHLTLGRGARLAGMIDIQSGNFNTRVKVDQAKIEGDATDNYCIKISDSDPEIIVEDSYLKANGSHPAVYWSLSNNNFKVKYSTIMHGSLGSNSPFGRGDNFTVDYSSHHCVYNTNPEGDTNFTNLIFTNYDVFDVDGDF